jgi:phage I-like protein
MNSKQVHANLILCSVIPEDGLVEEILIPDGPTKNRNGIDWIMDDESWSLIQSHFQAAGVSIPIDVKHEGHKEDIAPKDVLGAVGWVESLHYAKGRGIIGRIKWNEEGKRRIRGDQFRYLSPVIGIREDKKVTGLVSVGLVTAPAIPHMGRVASMEVVSNKEENVMEELKLIRNALGAGDSEPVDAMVKKIAAQKTSLDAATAVANAARTGLSLKDDASASEVGVAINSLKQAGDGAKAVADRLKAVENQLAERNARDLVAPFIASNKINPNAVEDLAMCEELARTNPDRFKKLMEERQPYVPPGRTQPPAGSTSPNAGKEEEMIENAVKAHQGNRGEAIVALQIKLKKPYLEQGLSHKAANQAAAAAYPKIFAA